jgi:hypothetical protein
VRMLGCRYQCLPDLFHKPCQSLIAYPGIDVCREMWCDMPRKLLCCFQRCPMLKQHGEMCHTAGVKVDFARFGHFRNASGLKGPIE